MASADPVNRVRAEACQVSRFLNPGVSLGGGVDAQPRTAGDAFFANVPAGLRGACRQEARQVGHVAAADEQTAAIGGIADKLCEPSNNLCFDFGGHRGKLPGADVRVHRGGQQVRKHSNGSRTRRDVAVETRMAVEKRVLEQQTRRIVQQSLGIASVLRKRPGGVQGSAHLLRRFRGRDAMSAYVSEELRDPVHQIVTE